LIQIIGSAKEEIIEDLNAKILELDSKVMEDEITINELKSKNHCESHLGEIGLLKVKVQNLENENRILRTSSRLSCTTKMDLEKLYVG
jgi:hypothetical protein